ncbi:MAG: two-component regulator propeller domain-containing protein [Saprospiraceae bacterium]
MIKSSPKFFVLIFILLSSWIRGIGQDPFYWQLTEEDGLPSMTIYQVHQDKKGFMWFGTENGICRYDGKEMETYYHPDLLDNEILTIQEDSWGRIWFKNLAGQLAFVEDGIINFSSIKFKTIKEFCVVNEFLLTFSNVIFVN